MREVISMSHGDVTNPNPTLIHVHRCAACGARMRRSRFNGPDSLSGVYEFSNCGQRGPLNIEIVEESVLDD